MPKKSNDLVPAKEIARVLGLTSRRISQLVAEGVLQKASRGQYRLAACVQAVIRHARLDRSASPEQKRVLMARAKSIELRNAEAENDLIPIAAVAEAVTEVVAIFRSELAGVPAAVTRDMALRAQVENALDAAIGRCRDRLEGMRDDFAEGRDPLAEPAA